MPKSSFETHMNIVNGSHTKTASVTKIESSLLDKLAAEFAQSEVDSAQKTAVPAAAMVDGAAAPVVSASDAIIVPQTEIAGGNQAEKEKGESTPVSKPAAIVISAGDGKVTDAQNFSKEPVAVAKAAESTGETEKTAAVLEAEEIGRVMARSYSAELQKIAIDQEYAAAVGILKEASLVDEYEFKDGIEKQASEQVSYLEKIANLKPLSKEDVVCAAYEYVEMQKQAAEADAYGRDEARKVFADLVKKAEDEAAEEKKDDEKDEKKKKTMEEEKTASDKSIQDAVAVLVKAGIVKA